MNNVLPILLRAAFTFAAFMLIQYKIPYFFLAPGGVVAGLFVLKTSDDRALGWGMMIGSAVFGVFALVMHQMGISQL